MKYIKIILDKLVLVATAVAVIVITGLAISVASAENNYNQKITKQEINEIYRKLMIGSGQAVYPQLIIVKSNVINAYTDGSTIVIFTGLIEKMNSKDEVAVVLGHELAHVLLNHVGDDNVPTVIKEAQADKYGAFLALRAGYDVCQGRVIFKKFLKLYGDDPNSDHPSNAYRYDQLNVGCDK